MSTPPLHAEHHTRLHFRVPLLILTLLTALGALAGGLAMVMAPDGRLLGWTVAMLEGSPFPDYLGPGLILLVVIGVGHLVTSVGLLLRRRSALMLAAVGGVALSGWILVQVVMVGFFWLQVVMLAVGLTELVLGLLGHRAHAPSVAPEALRTAERFLVLGRVVFVGLSREPRSFSRQIADTMRRRGLDVIGVNPKEPRADDTVAHLSEVPDLYRRFVFVLVPASRSLEVVEEAIASGAQHLWFHQGAGPGCASPEALARAKAAGLDVVSGLCPFMLLDAEHWMHGLHRDLRLGAMARARPS